MREALERCYTYKHNTSRTKLGQSMVLRDYVFTDVESCKLFMQRCLRGPEECVIVEGSWEPPSNFTGKKVLP
jgi:hypothetical protein